MQRVLKIGVAAVLLAFGAGPVAAAITVYTDEAAFRAAVFGPVAVDTFDDLPATAINSPLIRSLGDLRYSVSATPGAFSSDLFAARSDDDLFLSTESFGSQIVFEGFAPRTSGVGGSFFTTNLSGSAQTGTISVIALDDDGSVEQQILASSVNSFIGFVSTRELSQLRVDAPISFQSLLFPTVNNLVISPVPEPKTWLMFLVGFGALGASLRRRRRTSRTVIA